MVREPLTEEQIERGRALGALLRQARADRTMVDVARASGISVETLRKIEGGRIPTPAFFTVAAVAATLDLSLDALLARIDSADAPAPVAATLGPALLRPRGIAV
ncbi:helix-turn-helix domain-containing protein [Nocardiopsis ganjiahuensis]|uniref:helix-turn-helix domain-containing protein n=1 Tax=Nocardiopsis ganjiahuensis TaxID=239984 RepID=UPI00034DEDA4|nr:helix-turn-helix domain-containing protein [Nocardiopsis ganjiahuensis]